MNTPTTVAENRVKQFLESPYGDAVKNALEQWCYMRGLLEWDRESMWQTMLGNPLPIVVDPEPERFIDSAWEDEQMDKDDIALEGE